MRWSKEEDDFLLENYEKLDKEKLLMKLPKRSWEAIKIRSDKFKIKRYNKKERFADLDILLNDTYETYYWIGFIMADGNIINNRLRLRLSCKDKEHLEKFANFIGYKNPNQHTNNYTSSVSSICVKDTKYMKMFTQ